MSRFESATFIVNILCYRLTCKLTMLRRPVIEACMQKLCTVVMKMFEVGGWENLAEIATLQTRRACLLNPARDSTVFCGKTSSESSEVSIAVEADKATPQWVAEFFKLTLNLLLVLQDLSWFGSPNWMHWLTFFKQATDILWLFYTTFSNQKKSTTFLTIRTGTHAPQN